MAKPRKKKRTHQAGADGPGKGSQGNKRPKNMVIRMGAGDIGPSVTQLARDFRAVMEPDTASRLRVQQDLHLQTVKLNKLTPVFRSEGPTN
jgi:ribosome biogenesis protein SSF1/2